MALALSTQVSIGPDWSPCSREARALAGWLRRQRLTVLQGDDRRSLTSLLTAGVLPLLARRATDASASADADPWPLPSTSRDRRAAEASADCEILVLFDAKRERSVDLLRDRFDASVCASGRRLRSSGRLAHRVADISQRQRMRCLFVVDGFDVALAPSTPAEQDLLDEFVDLLSKPVSANVLIASTGSAWVQAHGFTSRLREIDPVLAPLDAPGPSPVIPARQWLSHTAPAYPTRELAQTRR